MRTKRTNEREQAPLVCVSEVSESLAVWRHNKPQTKKEKEKHRTGEKKKKKRGRVQVFHQEIGLSPGPQVLTFGLGTTGSATDGLTPNWSA